MPATDRLGNKKLKKSMTEHFKDFPIALFEQVSEEGMSMILGGADPTLPDKINNIENGTCSNINKGVNCDVINSGVNCAVINHQANCSVINVKTNCTGKNAF